MKKFINDPDHLTAELLEGFAIAHRDKVVYTPEGLVVRRKEKDAGKVALVTMGGSGHEPALSGFVGPGLLDISVPGEIFAAPGPPRVLEALRRADREAGVLFVVLNHEGDVLSSNMAMEMARAEGLNIQTVLTQEDISGGSRDDPTDRRGLVGCLLVYKVAGAAAEQGRSLEECVGIAQRMADNMATLAVATSSATHPATGEVISDVPDGEMIVGAGQHGEGGGGTQKLCSAAETAEIMIPALLDDLGIESGEKVVVMLNAVGSTTLMELYVVMHRVESLLGERGVELAHSMVGSFLSVQEMGGFQVCIARVDDEMLALLDAPCDSPALTRV